MLTVRREKFLDCIDQIMPLCQAAFSLGESSATKLQLDLDFDLYGQMEAADILHCLIARLDGKPIGIHWIYITPTPRHKGKLMAQTDVIYVDPNYRNHSMQIIQQSNDYIKSRADLWLMANRDYANRSKLWQRKGFEHIENIMIKVM